MKSFTYLLALTTATSAHYTFDKLVVNGVQQGEGWTYVREHTRGYMPTKGEEIMQDDFRCQPGGDSGANTDVYTVKGGDTVKLTGAYGMTSIEHPGPAQVYMSKATTGDVKSYDGSGEWFKVREALLCSPPEDGAILTDAWCTWGQDGIEFTIPERLPAGEYLARVEHIPLHGAQGNGANAEFYYSCAQLKVENSGAGTFAPTRVAKIPGMITLDDDAIKFNIWDDSIQEYPVAPGSELIMGGTTWGSKDGSSEGTVKAVQKRAAEFVGSAFARARAAVTL